MSVAVQQEFIPIRLAVQLANLNGTLRARWSEDETLQQNVLDELTFSDNMPGGDKDAGGVLARNPQKTWPDLEAFSNITVEGPGREIYWEGSLDKIPGVTGDRLSINPAALGYQAILEDNMAASLGIIDCDLSKWGEPSGSRKKLLLENGFSPSSTTQSVGFQGTGALPPGIFIEFLEFVEGLTEINESWYWGEGVDIGKVLFDNRVPKAPSEPGWATKSILSIQDIMETFHEGTNYGVTEHLQQELAAPSGGYKYAVFQNYYTGTFVGAFAASFAWTGVKVIGNHGMPYKGEWPNIGFSTKQCLTYGIPIVAPSLEAREEDIEDDEYVIPQAWYGERNSGANFVHDVTKYNLWDWYVRYGKRFHYRKPASYGKFWKAYVKESNLNNVGEDSQKIWNQIVVKYNDVDGTTKTVGPLGSGCTTESSALEITDVTNPATAAKRTRRDLLVMKGISTPAAAIAVGKRFLEEANALSRQGTATISGWVLDDKGVFWPAAKIRSGDWISFVDAGDHSYRKIVGRRYNHLTQSSEIELDAPPDGLEALLERLQAGLVSLGVES